MELSGSIFRFGGFVLAHSAAIAAGNEPGELICPYSVIVKDGKREAINFEAATQSEAIEKGWARFEQYRNEVDLWSLAREGLWAPPESGEPKSDVLSVSVWAPSLNDETIIFIQRFRPTSSTPFALIGPTEIYIQGTLQKDQGAVILRQLVSEGIAQHPKGDRWQQWLVQ